MKVFVDVKSDGTVEWAKTIEAAQLVKLAQEQISKEKLLELANWERRARLDEGLVRVPVNLTGAVNYHRLLRVTPTQIVTMPNYSQREMRWSRSTGRLRGEVVGFRGHTRLDSNDLALIEAGKFKLWSDNGGA